MMELLLIRHAKAEPYKFDDAERALTEKGEAQSRRVGTFLKKNDLVPELTLSSPLVRARQTAETVCEVAGAESPLVAPWLVCGMTPQLAMAELLAYRELNRIAIVGHQPDFSYLVAHLLGGADIHVRKASVIVFRDVSFSSGRGNLEMLVPVGVM